MAASLSTVQAWARGKEQLVEDLRASSSELTRLSDEMPTTCAGQQSVSVLWKCAGHRECRGCFNASAHPGNCPLAGMRNSNEPHETLFCQAGINAREASALRAAGKQVETICDSLFASCRPILAAAKLEAVILTVSRVAKVLFPPSQQSGSATENSSIMVLAQSPAECKLWLPRNHYLRLAICGHPLVHASLRSRFIDIIQKLGAVLDDLNMTQLMMNLFGIIPRAEWLAVGEQVENETSADDHLDETAVVQDISHAEEPVAVRDEDLLREQAEHDWADAVVDRILHEGPTQDASHATEQIFLYPYTRAPAEFKNILLEGEELRAIRDCMTAEGCDFVLRPSGAKAFVWPEQYQAVMGALDSLGMPLRASHVIIAESLLPALEASMDGISSRKNVRPKTNGIVNVANVARHAAAGTSTGSRADAGMPNDADGVPSNSQDETESWDYVFGVQGTFLCFARAWRDPGSVNQSTTEAHGGYNPRRLTGGALDAE
eukprot:gb/GFBE01006387.1/.p1 GENE.gb/GFBE01006387.1/~~gb/GFBE01006387.1/.p1  ORF type:complete len:491 (+),score=92.20 gb/GFBE01006387.1/:1-1473(+)